MASADELYRRTCDDVKQTPSPELDSETRRIWILIGALSDAFWRRANEPGFSIVEHLCQNGQQYRAESEDEKAVWNELTSPHNFSAVVRYVELRRGRVSEYAAQLHSTILKESQRRLESEELEA